MRIELVRSVPYERYVQEQQEKLAQARAQFEDEHGRMDSWTRRRWLTCAGAFTGSSILLPTVLGGTTAGCGVDELEALGKLILATILQYATGKLTYALDEVVGGPIELKNPNSNSVKGLIEMNLVKSEKIFDAGQGEYEVAAGTVNTYDWSGLATDAVGKFAAKAVSALNNAVTSEFDIA